MWQSNLRFCLFFNFDSCLKSHDQTCHVKKGWGGGSPRIWHSFMKVTSVLFWKHFAVCCTPNTERLSRSDRLHSVFVWCHTTDWALLIPHSNTCDEFPPLKPVFVFVFLILSQSRDGSYHHLYRSLQSDHPELPSSHPPADCYHSSAGPHGSTPAAC